MDKKLIVIIGGVALIAGLFLPIASSSQVSVNYMSGGIEWSGIVLIVCGALAVVLALINQSKHAVWLGIVALGLLVWRFLQAREMISQASAGAMPEGVEVPPDMAAQLAAAMPSINYLGWGVLGLGAVLILVGGALAWKSSAPPAA
jgi:hypothetical protein